MNLFVDVGPRLSIGGRVFHAIRLWLGRSLP